MNLHLKVKQCKIECFASSLLYNTFDVNGIIAVVASPLIWGGKRGATI